MPNGANANDPTQTRAYTETYTYDAVGSLTQLVHNYGGAQQWTRDYTVESTSNQLTSMTSAGTTRSYTYDAAGNLIQENTERHHEWDFAGRMRAFRNQVASSQASVFAHHTYDSGGQRVQKVVSKSGANPVHTVYIDGLFEHHVEIASDGSTAADYNREEYRPYGESSFGSFAKKRYRFTGKERDEESSLYYHEARYYAPWTARWTATDPLGMVDGPNLYRYVSGNPVRLIDRRGTDGDDSKASIESATTIVVGADDKAHQTSDARKKAELAGVGAGYDVEFGARKILNIPRRGIDIDVAVDAKRLPTSKDSIEKKSDDSRGQVVAESHFLYPPLRVLNMDLAGDHSYMGSALVRAAGARVEYIQQNSMIPKKILSEGGNEITDEMADRAVKMRRANEIQARGTVRNKAINAGPEVRNKNLYDDVYGPRSKEHFNEVRASQGKLPKSNEELVEGAGKTRPAGATHLGGLAGATHLGGLAGRCHPPWRPGVPGILWSRDAAAAAGATHLGCRDDRRR